MNGIPEVEKKGKVSRNKTTTAELEERICLKRTFPVITLITSLGSTILWTINIRVVDSEKNVGMFVLVVITPILISAGWVTNFLSKPDTVRALLVVTESFLQLSCKFVPQPFCQKCRILFILCL